MARHFLGGWRRARRMEGVRDVLKVSELNKECERTSITGELESLHGQYEVLICGNV